MPERLFVLLLALALTACGDDKPSDPPTEDPPTEVSTEEPPPATEPTRAGGLAAHARVAAVLSDDARAVLGAPDRLTLHSIEPAEWREYGYGRRTDPTPLANALALLEEKKGVLGSLSLDDAKERAAILEATYAGFIETGPQAACYDPRHALVYERGEETVIVFICFACHYAVVLEATTEKGRYTSFQDPQGLKPRLNGLLERAGIALAK